MRTLSRRSGLQLLAASSLTAAGSRRARAKSDPDVVVVGAGLSGLYTAFLLEQQGAKVLVLEGKHRVGGRVYSVDEVPGHPEGGANAIAGQYPRLRGMTTRLNIPLVDRVARNQLDRGRALVLDGKVIPAATWHDSPLNPFPDSLRNVMPWEYSAKVVAESNPFKSLDDWHSGEAIPYDVSLQDYLMLRGATEEMVELAVNTNFADGNSAREVSMLAIFARDLWQKTQRKAGRVNMIGKGGNQRIPEGIAKALKSEIRMGTKVIGLRTDKTGVDVRCQDGTVHRARFAVCSVPVPVIATMKIDPILKGPQAHAVTAMTYAHCTQVHMVASKPFWEDDGIPAGMWTDGPAGMVAPNTLGERPDEITSLTAYARGVNATYLDSIGAEAAKAVVIKEIEKARPTAKGRLKAIHIHSWQLDEFALGADFLVWGPGQVPAYYGNMWEPHGRIHFCGAHTAPTEFGMESAMESGERVALEVLKLI